MHTPRSTTVLSLVLTLGAPLCARAQDASSVLARYQSTADNLINAALKDSAAYNRLAELTDTFGNRLSGTPRLESAIDWVIAEMKKDGLSNVRGEKVMVPHWVRGEESASLVSPRPQPLAMLGLGGSVGTPARGITAEAIVVSSFDDLNAKAAQAKGRIVVFDVPFPQTGEPFDNYGNVVRYRGGGASEAAKLGAVAVLVRSVASFSIRSPHTGGLRYDTTVAKIPAAALAVEDAMLLHRMQNRGDKLVIRLKMSAQTLPDAPSRNVVAEIVGSELPNEVVVLGGHIDSWDVGAGAMDDGGGVVAAWEAVRLMKALGLKPRRTVRVVAWTNEENGGRGGAGYRDAHAAELDGHVLAIESDNGPFKPLGFSFVGSDEAYAMVSRVAPLLERIGAGKVIRGGGEADIAPLMARGIAGMGLATDPSKYFWYHHSDGDTIDKLDPHDLALCVATMAVMTYVVADMPERIPHGPAAARMR
ncbi:MAG: M28 family metallopeptidase [Gemmatimonadota bacterium]|nr:M28 family metallopeptidase [Gemmatimonadota bacterium]